MFETLVRALLPLFRTPPPPEIPADLHTDVETFRPSPRYLTYRLLSLALGLLGSLFGFAFVAIVLLVTGTLWGLVLGLCAVAFYVAKAAVLYVATRLDFEQRIYIVTDRSLRIREGVWTVREMTLTFANVQNVSVEQGPVERWLGIANVLVDTAGGGAHKETQGLADQHRAVLRGIDNAAGVRDRIRACIEQEHHKHAGLGDADERAGHSAGHGLSASAMALLREVREETRALSTGG